MSPLSLFLKTHDETVYHLYHGCLVVQSLFHQLKVWYSHNLDIPSIKPFRDIFGFFDINSTGNPILNQLLLVSKLLYTRLGNYGISA